MQLDEDIGKLTATVPPVVCKLLLVSTPVCQPVPLSYLWNS